MEQRIKFLNFDHNQNLPNKFTSHHLTIKGHIPKTNLDKYKTLYKNNKDNKLKPNTKVYLSPLAEFPSYKLKNYIEENQLNIKTTRKINELDYIIINHEFICSSYIDKKTNQFYIIPLEQLNTPDFISYFDTGNSSWADARRWTYYNDEEPVKITHFYLKREEYLKMVNYDNRFSFIEKLPLIEGNVIIDEWGSKRILTNLSYFNNLFDLIEQNNIGIIFDHNISDEANKDLSIDDDIFENIINMINSDDDDNLKIAKEILANIDLNSSRPYLIYLFNYFYQLKTSNNNKNYHYLKTQLKPNLHIHPSKNHPAIFDKFLPFMINEYPEYSEEFMNCFRIHMNVLCKKEIIKEIITH
jgi:hypothetical protein